MDIVEKIIEKYLNNINNEKQIQMFYEIGNIIRSNNINVIELSLYLKKQYGVVIAFTDRNLNNMIKFSNYDKSLLNKLKQITWKNILLIMKNNQDLIDICIKYKPTKKELEDYINKDKKLKKNDIIELDDMLEELKNIRR